MEFWGEPIQKTTLYSPKRIFDLTYIRRCPESRINKGLQGDGLRKRCGMARRKYKGVPQ